MNVYVFKREGFFYPLELPDDDTARRNAEINPGTTEVIRMHPLPEETVWTLHSQN